jgi:hypothetical protein
MTDDYSAAMFFECPIEGCEWEGSIHHLGTSPTPEFDVVDDELLMVTSIAEHLREEHGARMPGEREAAMADSTNDPTQTITDPKITRE